MPELSLIIPVMNESPNIGALSYRINKALAGLDHEVIWVNDGSTDDTSEMIKKYAGPSTRLIELSRNFGQSAALQAGIWQARGNYIATIDGDGQNDPADLPPMLELAKKNGFDMVSGIRVDCKDNFIRTFPSRLANELIRLATNTALKDLGCSTRILKKQAALGLPLKKGMHRYINVLLAKQKASILQIPVKHDPRVAGKSKYGLGRIFPVIRDLVGINARSQLKGPYTISHFEISSTWAAISIPREMEGH